MFYKGYLLRNIIFYYRFVVDFNLDIFLNKIKLVDFFIMFVLFFIRKLFNFCYMIFFFKEVLNKLF